MPALERAAEDLLRSMLDGISEGRLVVVTLAATDPEEAGAVATLQLQVRASGLTTSTSASTSIPQSRAPAATMTPATATPMTCPTCRGDDVGEPDTTNEYGCNSCGATWPAAPKS